jgi:hypothetical protein
MEKRVLEIEKLKAALGESMTQDEIEKKLREKIKSVEETNTETVEKIEEKIDDTQEETEEEIVQELEIDEKKIEEDESEEKEEEPVTFEIQMEEISPEKLAQLNKRRMEEKNGKSSINILIYIFSFIAIALMIFAGYLFMNRPSVKEVIVYKNSEPKEVIKEVVKEKIVTTQKEIDDKTLKSYFNSNKFETYKCYDFKVGQTTFPNECKSSLKEFLTKNVDSFKLEITAVVSPDDVDLIYKANLGDASIKMREYIIRGFSRERVLETSFYIKDFIKEDVILTPVNYYVTSQKLSKGVIIKAYYLDK